MKDTNRLSYLPRFILVQADPSFFEKVKGLDPNSKKEESQKSVGLRAIMYILRFLLSP